MTAAIAASTVRHARAIVSSSASVFTRRRRLTSAAPVRSRSSPKMRPSSMRRLGPHPVADRNRRGRAEALRHALEDRPPVVGLVDHDDLAFGTHRQVEHDDHAGQHEHRLGVRPEEATRDPAVRVGALPEERNPTLDARQVLEVGREAEEEQVDTLLPHDAPRASDAVPRGRTRRRSYGSGASARRDGSARATIDDRAQAPAAGRLPPVGVRRRDRRRRRARRARGRTARDRLVLGLRGRARGDVRGERALPPLPVEDRRAPAVGAAARPLDDLRLHRRHATRRSRSSASRGRRSGSCW